ncbi:MAG TPA: phosphate acyltransferase PlsX [Nitrospina sp.]|jgi:glycerol-3-phosphate acyltransferase PlsX|nr:phosphate acyltransferase PlsX [Nitrospina sp.]HCK68757.1 phosphate acyltransferase PlsX [Nitrospina sp.]|tara:strand:+ start:7379 stop:8509 length:1131 start_codon:yes stop_codon:yes gene_type:complete
MKIVVDAMGGDHAPEATVEGAVLAAREYETEIILTGLSDLIHPILDRFDPDHNLPIEVVHADEVVEMHDLPGKVLRSKRKSSMKIGLDKLKDGTALAFVSAGNTGAVLAYSTVILRPLKGVDRPAIAIQLPTLKGNAILLDAGANVDCKVTQLFQFGIMGHVFAEYILGKENPRVGLLSIGEEDGKGNEIVKEVFQMLKASHINFIGNIEGKEVYRGNADVIVCDGFTGNIALKISESLAAMIGTNLKRMFQSNWASKLSYLLLKPQLDEFKKKVDYSETGGAPLLGVNGVVIIAHGSSSPKAIKNAIHRACELCEKNINEHIREDIESNLMDVEAAKGTIWKQIKEMAFGGESEEGEKPTPPQKPGATDKNTDET